jgi:hypothetical protein
MHPHPKNSGDGIRQALNIDLKPKRLIALNPILSIAPPPKKKNDTSSEGRGRASGEGGGQLELIPRRLKNGYKLRIRLKLSLVPATEVFKS